VSRWRHYPRASQAVPTRKWQSLRYSCGSARERYARRTARRPAAVRGPRRRPRGRGCRLGAPVPGGGSRPLVPDTADLRRAYFGVGEVTPARRSAPPSESRSGGRRRQDFLVLGAVLRLSELGRHDQEIVVHFGPGEGLAELGHELTLLEVPCQDLQLFEVLHRRLAHQEAPRTLLPVLLQPLPDHLVDGLGLLWVLDVGRREALVGVGQLLAVGRLTGQHLEVVGAELPRPFQSRGDAALLVRLWALTADEVEAQLLPLLQKRRCLVLDGVEPVVGPARQLVHAEDALGVPAAGVLKHRYPLVLVRQVP